MAIKFSKNLFTWADTIVRLYLFSENVSTPKEPEEVPSRYEISHLKHYSSHNF